MDDQFSFQINIPSDEDGYILLQCPLCGELFKLSVKDIDDEDVFDIWCPFCGLTSVNYLTDEVIELAMIKAKNNLDNFVHHEIKKIERKIKRNYISFKITSKPAYEFESPLIPIIDSLIVIDFKCCNRTAKVSPSLKTTIVFCPFCGVYYEHK